MTQLVTDWLHRRDIEALKLAHPQHTMKGVGNGYEFIEGELELAKALGMGQARTAAKALVYFDHMVGLKDGPILMATTKGIQDKLIESLAKLNPIMQQTWNVGLDRLVTGIIGKLSEVGARRAGAFRRFKNLPTRAIIEEGMVASAKYYSNNHFNRVVLPSMTGHINKQLASGGAFDATYFRALRETMDTRLKSVPHWRLVANQAASRSYHYGLTRAGMLDGYSSYTLSAVKDERTTDVCLNLDGRTFHLADGVARVERVARMLPSKIAEDAPWLVLGDVEDVTTAELSKRDILMPPFHGNCRTTITMNR